jgi:HlyD family secretion protein
MKWTKNRKLLAGISLALVILVAFSVGGWLGDDGVDPIDGVLVRRGDLRISVLARGNLEAKDSARLVNELEGRANIIYLIEEGTRVAVGDVVCELDTSGHKDRLVDQAISVDRAQASFIDAQAQYEIQVIQNASDAAEADLALELAQLRFEAYVADEGEWEGELARAEEAIVLAEESIKQAEETLEWTEKLYGQGFVQKTELDRDRLNVTQKRISRDQALRDRNLKKTFGDRARRKELSAGVESRKRDLEVVRKQAAARLVDFESERVSAERELERQIGKHVKLMDQVSKGTLRAPEAGLVVYGRRKSRYGSDEVPQEGSEVHERQTIITIPRAGGMTADVSLHETKLDKVRVGLACLIRVDALPGKLFHGRVAAVAAVADSGSWMSNPNQRLYRTEVALATEVPEMRPGMSCSIEILVEDLKDVLYVPRQSVFLDGGRTICFVHEGGRPHPREIEVGRDNNKWVHVVTGLEEGETVLLSPPASWEPAPPPDEESPAFAADDALGAVADETDSEAAIPAHGVELSSPPADALGGDPGRRGMGSFSAEQMEAMRKRVEAMSDEERAEAMKHYRAGGGSGGGGRDRGTRSEGEQE